MTLNEAFDLYNSSNYFQKSNIFLISSLIIGIIELIGIKILIIYDKKKEKEGKQNSFRFRDEIILLILVLTMLILTTCIIGEQITNVLNSIKNNTEAFNQFYLRYHQNELSVENQQLLKEASKQFYELNIEEKEIKNENKTCYSWNLNKSITMYCLSNKNSEANKETKDEFEKFIIMRYLFNEKHNPNEMNNKM